MYESCYRIYAIFTLKDSDSKNKFVDWCNGTNGLSVTRGYTGCLSLDMFESLENQNKVVIWQRWDSKEHQEAYIKHRHDDGTFDLLTPMMSAPPEITPIREMTMKTDEQQIEDVVRAMCNKDHNVGMKHTHSDCVFIRPTGNPLDMDAWNNMMNNTDVNVDSNDLVAINKLEVCGDMAYVCYTNHGVFNYKGTSNDDVAVLTSVLRKLDGRWMVVHGQRSTGRKPTDAPPKF